MSRGRELSKVGGLTQTIAGISTFVGISTFASDVRIHGKLDVDGDITYDEMTAVNSKVTGITTVTDVRVDRNLIVAGIATFTTALANSNLANSSVSYGGVSVALGAADATPAFDLSDATNYPTSSLSGTITNAQLAGSIANDKLAGSIANAKLANSTVSYGGVSLALGATDATPAFDLQDATGYPTSSLTGTITNAQLAGSIANAKLANSSVSYGGVSLALGATDATPAFNLADATGLPISTGVSGLAANVATFLGTPSSANLLAALTDETGTGAAVFGTSPTIATPTLTGTAVAANLDISGAVDIDGHLDADNVSIAGVSTMTGASTFSAGVTIAGALDANGGASIDNIQIGVTGDNEIDTSSGNLTIDSAGGTVTVDDNLTVSGDLTVNGTTTTINSTTVAIDDKNFQVATGAADDAAANGAGLTVDSGDGDKTWNFEATGDNWGSSENINVATGKAYKINNSSVLNATTLGSSVVASSLTSVGTIATGVWQGTAIANGYLANSTVSYGGVSLSLGGSDGTPAFDLSDATNYPTSSLSGTITNAQLAGSIADSKLNTISTAGKVDLAALEIDGGTDIGADLVDADLFIVDDGAGGTNRKTTGTRIKKYIWSSASGDATASDAGAITLAASGVSAGTVGSSSAIPVLTIDAKGRITGTSTAALSAGTNITQGNSNVTVADTGTGAVTVAIDGSTLATFAAAGITLSSGAFVGNVTGNTSGSSGSCTGNAATATALATARTIAGVSFDGTANIALNNNAITNGAGYITSSGTAANATLASTSTITANNSTDETVYPVFVDGATGAQGLESDTGLTYNPSSGALTSTSFVGALTGNVTGNASGSSGSCTGNSATATLATTVTLSANNTANETVYPTFADGATGTQDLETDTGLTYNPSTGMLTSTGFTGTLTGNVTGNVTGNTSGSSGSCTGNSATATEATNITAVANNTTDETVYPTFVDGATGTQGIETDTGLTYNPSSGVLTATQFTGALSGNASTATALATARTIGGVSFDGTANITLPGVNSAGNQNTTGNAATATALATARTIAGVSFDGSANISLNNNAITNGAGYVTSSGWTSSNDGAGSGLDADLLDGVQGASYLRSDASDTFTGTLTVSGDVVIDNITANGNTVSTSTGNLTLDSTGGTVSVNDNLTVAGNLTVNGTTTTINSTTVAIDDKNFQVATGAADDAAADGAGLTVDSGDGDKTWNFEATGDNWGASENINIASGKSYKINNTAVLNATTLGSSVVASSLTSVGTISSGTWEGTAIGNDYIATITAIGKVALSALEIDGGTDIGAALADADLLIVDDGAGGTNRKMAASRIPTYIFGKVSGDITVNSSGVATIAANSVALSTDTTGNYVAAGAVSGNGLSGSASAEGATFTVTSNATNANTASTIVYRDGSGDFSAGTITASLTGNVTGNASGSSGSCTGNSATATTATNVTASANNSTDETVYPTFVDGATGTQGIETDTGLTYNPSSGNLTATTFTGALTGNVTGNTSGSSGSCTGNSATATLATSVTASANNTANETVYPTFVDGATGTQGIETDTSLTYNPSSNTLTAGTFSGSLSGTASNAALLDSLDSSQFLRSDASDTYTGTLTVAGNVVPDGDSSRDLGTNSVRFANIYGDDIYAGDIHMSNEHRGGNTVDGTWGSYLFEEGENDLFITNRRNGKKFRLVLEAI